MRLSPFVNTWISASRTRFSAISSDQSATSATDTQKLNDQMQNLVEALSGPRDGSRLNEIVQARDSLDPVVHKLADEIVSSEADSMSKGALLGLQEKLAQLATQISTVHNFLASVETGKARTEARAVVKPQSNAPPFETTFD